MEKNQGCSSQIRQWEGSAPAFPCTASHTHTDTRIRGHTRTHNIHTRVCAPMHTHIQHTHVCAPMHAHTYNTHACVHLCTRTHTTYTRVHMHTRTYRLPTRSMHSEASITRSGTTANPVSASVFGLCLLFASSYGHEEGLTGKDSETQDEAVPSPPTRFASG